MTHTCLFCGGDASEKDHLARCDGRQGAIEAEADPKPFEPYRAPYAKHSETSEAAGRSVEPTAASLCGQILAVIKVTPRTCAEIETQFGLRHQTASARIWDLRTRAYIRDSGRKRPTPSGRQAVVWEAVSAR